MIGNIARLGFCNACPISNAAPSFPGEQHGTELRAICGATPPFQRVWRKHEGINPCSTPVMKENITSAVGSI